MRKPWVLQLKSAFVSPETLYTCRSIPGLTKSGESGKECKGVSVAQKDKRSGPCDCVVTHSASSFVFYSSLNLEPMELL